jgi:hypothetical protein
MQQNQHDFILENQALLDALANIYEPDFDSYLNLLDEAEIHHDDPHEKKMLRIQAWEDILSLNLAGDHLWYLPKRGTVYKMKIFEIAKPGKVPRMIGDLGVHASLQGFRSTHYMKKAMANHVLRTGGGQIQFCPSPTPSALGTVFHNLIEPQERFYFSYFSDDSCLAVRPSKPEILAVQKVLWFNVDISSCDASHALSLFLRLKHLFPKALRDDVQVLIDQCTTEIEIFDLFNRKRSQKMTPFTPRLYSGSTLTTIINNLANLLIAISISKVEINSGEDVILAAAKAGYTVTCEACTDWRDLQFLKHSPVRAEDGIIRPLMNPGVLLRLSGTCKGDLPGTKKQSLESRALSFQASLLNGAYPHASFTLLRNLRSNAGLPSARADRVVASMLEYKVAHDAEYPSFSVSSEEVWRRYRLTALEIAELDHDFGSCTYADHFRSSGVEKVLKKDYGLGCAAMPDEEDVLLFQNEKKHVL